MVSRVNLKARIQRHSRVLKHNIWNIHPLRAIYHKINNNFVIFTVIFFFPIYPMVSSFFYEYSFEYYRANIDESTILDYYINEDNNEDYTIISNDSFISVNSLLETKRDLTWFNEVIEYEVQPWESFSSIAYKFWVSTNSILWANNFTSSKVLHPWNKIKIPPVSWLIHKVESWDSISSLAKKYKIEEDKIISQNNLEVGQKLDKDLVLIMPWAIKAPPPPPPKPVRTTRTTTTQTAWYAFTQWWSSEYINTSWAYTLVKRTPVRTFYWGNCTRYVAQYKNVTWGWNANQWLTNARAQWVPTWVNPWLWSIIVLNGRWYDPRYWHVWIVIDITSDSVIVRDMNYRRLNEVTTRKIPKNDRAIQWYIYVD